MSAQRRRAPQRARDDGGGDAAYQSRMTAKSPRTFFWPIFGVVILASALSLTTGLLAALIGLALHVWLCVRLKAPLRPTSVILIVFAPVFGMIASAILFMLGPGF